MFARFEKTFVKSMFADAEFVEKVNASSFTVTRTTLLLSVFVKILYLPTAREPDVGDAVTLMTSPALLFVNPPVFVRVSVEARCMMLLLQQYCANWTHQKLQYDLFQPLFLVKLDL